MTKSDRMEIARKVIQTNGVGEVARRIDRSSAAVSLVNSGKYAGSPDKIVELILAAFTAETVNCPVLGEVAIADCLDARKRSKLPYFPSSAQSTALYHSCKECERGKS